jgi:RND family efflux transporter MFP subunit
MSIRDLQQNDGLSDREAPGQAPAHEVPRPPSRWKSRVLAPTALLAAAVGLLLASAETSLLPAPTVRVEAAVPRTTSAAAWATPQVQAAGWLEAAPYLHHVSALTNGVLREVRVLEGGSVEAGSVVATLVDDDAQLAVKRSRAALALRRAAVAEAQARHEAAEANWRNPVDFERRVAVSATQLKEARAGVAAAQARLDQQQAVLTQARRDWERAKKLVATGVIARQEAEEAQKEEEVAQAARDVYAKALHQAVLAVERMSATATAAQRDLDLRIADKHERDAAAAALSRARAEVKMAEAVLAEAELRLRRTEIRAPVGGVVVTRWKAPGDKLMLAGDSPRSATVVSLYDPAKMQARVDVPLADAAKIAVGQRCEVICDVLPDQSFPGRVDRILHAADIQKNTLEVKVVLEKTSPALRPEMLCRVRFLADATAAAEGQATAVFAPAGAVRDGRVWLVRSFDGVHGAARSLAVPAETQPAPTVDGWIAAPGLRAGDLVITSPPGSLREGERVRVEGDPS